MFKEKDKRKERSRYDSMSERILSIDKNELDALFLESRTRLHLQAPYRFYESLISQHLNDKKKVLEIGSGIGHYSGIIAKTGAKLFVTDISEASLKVASNVLADHDNINYRMADMEDLPFEDGEFDAICSAGSLSYGDFYQVKSEIKRVLKKEGLFICVDSLNNNPIYKINRYFSYLRGKRSLSTLNNMISTKMIDIYSEEFRIEDIKYFGSLSWLCSQLPNNQLIANMSNNFDKYINAKSSCFKFVMKARVK
ncbi:class I SAM-dependent methyltransferase [Gammaproteobacteria bacterium]|mgnify:CR=1 FL=1|nr:class I SAM-dependent methyltransferase [Gammaproteobacteria bacterium]